MAILPAGAKQSKIARPTNQEEERNKSAGNASALPFLLERSQYDRPYIYLSIYKRRDRNVQLSN